MARKTGCPLSLNLIIINSATRSHSPCGLSLQVECHFVSDPGRRNDQCPAGNLFANKDTSVELAIHSYSLSIILHRMSLNIDMKIIRPWNCSGSLILFMNFWTSWTSCNVVNPGKYSTRIPSAHQQKMIPFITCEIALCQYVCELVLGVNVLDLGSKLILSNNQPRATPWVLETCLIVGLLPFMTIWITASLSSKIYNKASLREEFTSHMGVRLFFVPAFSMSSTCKDRNRLC